MRMGVKEKKTQERTKKKDEGGKKKIQEGYV
jgi:hypothetical protein